MASPINVTPEMRQAVYAEDCLNKGHSIKAETALYFTNGMMTLQNIEGLIPHLNCERCGKVWLVVETPGADYTDAETQYNNSLLPANRKPPRVRKQHG